MKTCYIWRRVVLCAALGVVFGFPVAEAQTRARPEGKGAAVLRIHQLTGYGPRSLMRSPDSSGNSRNRNVREWVEMAVQFDTDPEWVDEVTFTYYALLKHRATGDYTLLKGVVTYVDVARGRAHQGVAYIRPNALARLGEVVGVAVEAQVKGEVVSSYSEGKLGPNAKLPQEWWLNPKLAPKEGYIVDKSKTPFALVNFDDYEAAK
jgi:hypothetical protein